MGCEKLSQTAWYLFNPTRVASSPPARSAPRGAALVHSGLQLKPWLALLPKAHSLFYQQIPDMSQNCCWKAKSFLSFFSCCGWHLTTEKRFFYKTSQIVNIRLNQVLLDCWAIIPSAPIKAVGIKWVHTIVTCHWQSWHHVHSRNTAGPPSREATETLPILLLVRFQEEHSCKASREVSLPCTGAIPWQFRLILQEPLCSELHSQSRAGAQAVSEPLPSLHWWAPGSGRTQQWPAETCGYRLMLTEHLDHVQEFCCKLWNM